MLEEEITREELEERISNLDKWVAETVLWDLSIVSTYSSMLEVQTYLLHSLNIKEIYYCGRYFFIENKKEENKNDR